MTEVPPGAGAGAGAGAEAVVEAGAGAGAEAVAVAVAGLLDEIGGSSISVLLLLLSWSLILQCCNVFSYHAANQPNDLFRDQFQDQDLHPLLKLQGTFGL